MITLRFRLLPIDNRKSNLTAISRVAIVVVIIVILIVAGVGVYFATRPSTTTTPTTATTGTTATSDVTSTTGTASSSSTPSSQTLSIDDYAWPTGNLNELNAPGYLPYPDWLEGTVYQTLVIVNLTAEQDQGQFVGVFQPGLASAWNSSANGENYTFTLQKGVTFSDGNAFNAYSVWAVFYTWYYLTNYSATFWNGLNIFNTTGLSFNMNTFGSLVNSSGLSNPSSQLIAMMSNSSMPAYVTSNDTINFQLDTPFPFFVNSFTGFQGMMFDPTYMFQHGGAGSPGSINQAFNLVPIPGTGPYMVTAATFESSVQFTQYSSYWGDSLSAAQIAADPILNPGSYKNVVIYDITNPTTSFLNLQNNDVQMAAVTGSDFQLVNSETNTYGLAVIKHPATLVWMFMNNQRFPTNITDVRQAIVHAINYTQVIQAGAFGYGTRMLGPEAPFYGPYYDPGNFAPYQTNDTLASADLTAAGFPGGAGLPALTCYIDVLGEFYESPMAQVIQANLAAVNITMNIQVVTDAVYYQYYGSYSTNLANAQNIPNLAMGNVAGFSPDYLAPTDFWGAFVTTFSPWGNFAIFNSTAVTNYVASISHDGTNTTAIINALTAAEGIIYAQAPDAWLFDAELPAIQGSYAYKIGTINSNFFMEPNLEGVSDIPLFNTLSPG